MKLTKSKMEDLVSWGLDDASQTDITQLELSIRHVSVTRCLKYARDHFSRPIQLKELVQISGMSRRGFIKAFKTHVGMNPGVFLRSMRIEHAKRLLIDQDLPLKEIATRCGFKSENTFCVAFLRRENTSPKRYQRQYWMTAYRRHREVSSQILSLTHALSAPLQKSKRRNDSRYFLA